jgi:hypothetical protein
MSQNIQNGQNFYYIGSTPTGCFRRQAVASRHSCGFVGFEGFVTKKRQTQ